jgi:hypothetical protein
MKSLHDVPAPAKLNLFLHINGRRPDGYHLLQSVFMLIDWCDTLHFEKRSGGGISREDLTVALPDNDLITRAARLLQTHTGCADGVHIAVEKQIPAQAGMGGGSSDAATCLLALNRLWKLKLKLTELETLGLKLGADVPFFLRGRNAWVEVLVKKSHPSICLRQIFGYSNLQRVSKLLKFLRTPILNVTQTLLQFLTSLHTLMTTVIMICKLSLKTCALTFSKQFVCSTSMDCKLE